MMMWSPKRRSATESDERLVDQQDYTADRISWELKSQLMILPLHAELVATGPRYKPGSPLICPPSKQFDQERLLHSARYD